jgi:hypothetical protein
MFCAGSALAAGLAHAVAAEILTRAASRERGSQRRMLAPAATHSPDVNRFPVLVMSGWPRKPHARCEQSTFLARVLYLERATVIEGAVDNLSCLRLQAGGWACFYRMSPRASMKPRRYAVGKATLLHGPPAVSCTVKHMVRIRGRSVVS